jgi:uncharacterized protein (DUF4415 family)
MNKQSTLNSSMTDWEKLDAMKDEDIDLPDAPEITPEMFVKAVIAHGLKPDIRKEQVTLRIDSDVLTWFREQGPGYQTKINRLLRAYVEAHQV